MIRVSIHNSALFYAVNVPELGGSARESRTKKVTCKSCKVSLERKKRRGFLEQYVLVLFGLYPWRCYTCYKTIYRLERYDRSRVISRLDHN